MNLSYRGRIIAGAEIGKRNEIHFPFRVFFRVYFQKNFCSEFFSASISKNFSVPRFFPPLFPKNFPFRVNFAEFPRKVKKIPFTESSKIKVH